MAYIKQNFKDGDVLAAYNLSLMEDGIVANDQHAQSDHAPADAQENIIETIKVNGVEQSVKDKAVDISITIPTKVSELTNDEGYLTPRDISNKADKATTLAGYGISNAYTKDEVDDKIAIIPTPDVPGQIDAHNADTTSHNDIREKINEFKVALDGKVSVFDIPTDPYTTMLEIITTIQNAGGNVGRWNIINFIGYTSSTIGITMQHYGGNIYNISVIDLSTMATISCANDYSIISLAEFMRGFTYLQSRLDNGLETTDKTIVGAINEIQAKIPVESIVGTWMFNDVLTPIDKAFEENFAYVNCSGSIAHSNGEIFDFTSICFLGNADRIDEIVVIFDDEDVERSIYYAGEGFCNGYEHRIITITEEPTDEIFIAWLKANAVKQTLYQLKEDVLLETENKTIVGAINELKNAVQEALNKANSFPSYSTSNNGQFLRIVNGVPTWVTISNAEEATF
jgi:hypothetical protein